MRANKITRKKKSNWKILNILELPNEILFRIIYDLSGYHRQKIRASCRRLKTICDGQMIHDFRKVLNKKQNQKKFSYQALKAIQSLSNVYVKAGLESVFAGALISFVEKTYKTPFISNHKSVKAFIRNFMQLADQQVPGQRGQLLYTLMILNLLNVSRKCK